MLFAIQQARKHSLHLAHFTLCVSDTKSNFTQGGYAWIVCDSIQAHTKTLEIIPERCVHRSVLSQLRHTFELLQCQACYRDADT
jgi:hypothetical protein